MGPILDASKSPRFPVLLGDLCCDSRYLLGEEEGPDGTLLLRSKVTLNETQDEARLTDPLISKHNHLLQIRLGP